MQERTEQHTTARRVSEAQERMIDEPLTTYDAAAGRYVVEPDDDRTPKWVRVRVADRRRQAGR